MAGPRSPAAAALASLLPRVRAAVLRCFALVFSLALLAGGRSLSWLATATGFRFSASGAGRWLQRRAQHHAVLDLATYETWTAWARGLSRSVRTTLLAQVDRAAAVHSVRLHASVGPAGRVLVSLEHFGVILAHQRRVHAAAQQASSAAFVGRLAAPLRIAVASVLRWLKAVTMPGDIDEWRSAADGSLVAWSATVCKGSTLRGMWFYTADAGAMLWFAALRLHVARGIAMPGVRFVDAGPSANAAVEALKLSCGCRLYAAADLAPAYDGPWRPCLAGDAALLIEAQRAETPAAVRPASAAAAAAAGRENGAPAAAALESRRAAAQAKAERKAAKAAKRAARVAARHHEDQAVAAE